MASKENILFRMTDRQLKYCATLGLGIGLYLIYRQQSKKKRLVGTLAALEIFPMKSAAGIPVNRYTYMFIKFWM